MKKLIVNADDFGLTENVNSGILDAYRDGILTSTTLLANGMAFESAVAASKKFQGLGIGVHLNLTEGRPVADASLIPTLIDRGGRLYMTPPRLWAGIVLGRVNPSEIEIELRAQVLKVIHAGIRPTHFDGHKHVHVLPHISEIVIRLAREFRVPAVRCPLERNAHASKPSRNRELSRISIFKQFLVGLAVSKLATSFREKLAREGLLSSSYFYGIRQTGFLNAAAIREILKTLPAGTSELMCHPGYRDVDLERTGTRLLAQRETEMDALTDFSVKDCIVSGRIQLWSYRDLVALTQLSEVAG
jgi:hopanoid biosynthesis associated protein HpnK